MALAILLPPRALHAQQNDRGTIGISVAIPDSTVAGVVYDARDGKPISGAAVSIASTARYSITDALGRFKISVAGIRDSTVRVRATALAYNPNGMVVAVGKSGVGVTIRLDPGPDVLCKREELVLNLPGGFTGRPQGVTLHVRDLLSGVAPKSAILMVVADSAAADTARSQVSTGEYLTAEAGAGLGKGPLTVRVQAAGYHAWTLSGIQRDVCGKPIGSPFGVWLLPK
jgi:hypothetical protein